MYAATGAHVREKARGRDRLSVTASLTAGFGRVAAAHPFSVVTRRRDLDMPDVHCTVSNYIFAIDQVLPIAQLDVEQSA
jgi:hypothetical protein